MAVSRRTHLIDLLEASADPITGAELAERLGVSRQVIVQDIALLRASGVSIAATTRGYLLSGRHASKGYVHTFTACHEGPERMREELMLIVEFGCTVLDVIVEHPIYGEISAALHLSTADQVAEFIAKTESSNAQPLSLLTSGVHVHTVRAPSERAFKALMTALKAAAFIPGDASADCETGV